ncbi:RHS repeat-associated core domain-containing protein [Shewanella chilikensis]|uniref:RHS repeat-associated core domain-containing protein n=1 Tax=Shewanella chilikensis TaxID=558541 RepID=UPI002DD45024|nr:RHS repeat-associated core domain-containing protein [Shewanella chilikensis]
MGKCLGCPVYYLYYDPLIGRFYSNDPVDTLGHMDLGNPVQGFNRYAYANNNPYKYTDPDGKFLQFIPAIIAAAKIAHKAYKVYKSNKRIQKVLKNKQSTGKKGEHTSSNGGKEVEKDFKTLTKGSDVKTYENGTKVGKTPDGRTVDKHGSSGKSGKGADVEKGTDSIKIKNESGKRTQTTIRYPEDKI